jgi:putative DNA primase/helicase
MIDIRALAHAAGGEVVNRDTCLIPGPGHSRHDRSLSVTINPSAPDGFMVYSHAGDDPLACRDYVRQLLGLPAWRPGEKPREDWKPSPEQVEAARRREKEAADDEADRISKALAIWGQAQAGPDNSPIRLHFERRGITCPPEAAGTAIRWHSQCPFGKGARVGAMVALVRDVLTNEPRAIHRTAIDSEGRKLSHLGENGRLAYGPTGGGAVKFTPDEDTFGCLGAGEGIETTLSLRNTPEFGPRSPVWALLNASQLAALPALPGIECLWLAVDHDEAGIGACETTSARWLAAGAETFLVRPTQYKRDLNDVAKRAPDAA